MGAGRSGSTILGVALGNCKGVFYAGELDKWLMRSGQPALDGGERLQFWEQVRDGLDASDLFGYEARVLERSSALFSAKGWRARRRVRERYRRISEQLYHAIARVAGVTHVVDTSHYPLRARELQSLDAIDLHLILLIRDPRGVVASLGRSDVVERHFGTLTANAYLWLTHVVSLFVFLRHPRERRTLLHYEDLLADPEGVTHYLLERVGAKDSTPDFAALRTGFPIQGNRLIRSEVVALERGDGRGPRSPITTLLQLPWRVVFRWLGPRPAAPPARKDGGQGSARLELQ
jgi:hypothetical protein